MLIVAGGGIVKKGVRVSWKRERASVKAVSEI
jgi:hypothetical protein